jgi:glutathione S-transferase
MSLTLYSHPLSSFCQKALIALYETGAPFKQHIVDLREEASRAAFLAIWPIGKFPVLRDESRDRLVPESSIIIEYLAQHYPGKSTLVPADPDAARQMRLRDRFFDLYINVPMQKVIGDRMRPAGKADAYGVEEARRFLQTAFGMLDREVGKNTWIMGETFTMGDCAAAPALFYANMVAPFTDSHKNLAAYFQRLTKRPSYARVMEEAKPYLSMVPT